MQLSFISFIVMCTYNLGELVSLPCCNTVISVCLTMRMGMGMERTDGIVIFTFTCIILNSPGPSICRPEVACPSTE